MSERVFGVLLSAYHEDHHDWVLSIVAKKSYTCTCLRCKRKKKHLEDMAKLKKRKKKVDWAQELVYKV